MLIILEGCQLASAGFHYRQPTSSTSKNYLTFSCEKSIKRHVIISVTNLTHTSYCSDSGWTSRHTSLVLVPKSVLLFQTELPNTPSNWKRKSITSSALTGTSGSHWRQVGGRGRQVLLKSGCTLLHCCSLYLPQCSKQLLFRDLPCFGCWDLKVFLIVSYPGESLANTNQFMDQRDAW